MTVMSKAAPIWRYKNPWHEPHSIIYGPEFFTCDKAPIEYRGFQIFHQRATKSWELVKDGVCLTQRCGKNLQPIIDRLLDDHQCEEERIREIAARCGIEIAAKAEGGAS